VRVSRRGFVLTAGLVPLCGFARGDTLTLRKATFEEIGGAVVMSIDLPGLFRWYDTEAFDALDSNLDNTLQFTLRVREYGTRQKLVERTLIRKVRRDPWKKKYVVSTREGKRWAKRIFDSRDDAVAFSVALDRVRIADTSDLERGEAGPYYYVEVLALRNPLSGRDRTRRGSSDRSRGRDLEWFGRLVEVFAGERAIAEEVVHVRTNPFYLLPR
jgi:hypothetical protein